MEIGWRLREQMGGTGQEGSPDETLWWVRLGYERLNDNLRAKPAQPVFVN